MQRDYVRRNTSCMTERNFYNGFSNWLDVEGDIQEEKWMQIMLDDEAHPYQTHPVTKEELENTSDYGRNDDGREDYTDEGGQTT